MRNDVDEADCAVTWVLVTAGLSASLKVKVQALLSHIDPPSLIVTRTVVLLFVLLSAARYM
jgi:hypothetical protein